MIDKFKISNLKFKMSAFTLIELLVVISIIGVLMGIGFVAFKQAQAAGRDTKRKADIEQIKTALELFHEECGRYPSILAELSTGAPFKASCQANDPEVTYLAKTPQDPLYPTYTYWYGGTSGGHTVCAYLERESGSGYKVDGYTVCLGRGGRWLFDVSCGAAICNYSVLTRRDD